MESKIEIAILKILSENDNKGEEHGGESWENFKDKSVEIDSHNPENPLLFPAESQGDTSTDQEHAGNCFDPASKEELIPEHKAKAETKLTRDENFTKAIKAFESFSSSCCEIQRVEQNRIGEIVRTLKEMKMSQMNIVESSPIPTVDEASNSTTKESTIIFKNISIQERSMFKCSDIKEEEYSSDFSDESNTLLNSPADYEYWGAYEDVTSSSPMSSVSSKGEIKLIRTAYDQHNSGLKMFYEPLSPEFDVNIEAGNKQSWFSSVKEIKRDIVAKVKRFGKKKRDPMNAMLDAGELRRKLEEHLENEKRKLD
ncbi:hypothetical protein L6164_025275 [Bauhinia variegata]|uniref:Uncharacterized protein n=1 Tax=Bauhinia variegata TaxID=167791 RepID=A0ACB9M0H2_BAUVA|nr:hypothetical protein L6164_025275 [Bauhinia variegata]